MILELVDKGIIRLSSQGYVFVTRGGQLIFGAGKSSNIVNQSNRRMGDDFSADRLLFNASDTICLFCMTGFLVSGLWYLYLKEIFFSFSQALADENEFVRETALKAGQRIVNTYAESAITLLLPELEAGLFHDNWRIRYR